MVDYKKVLFLKYGQRKSTREIAAILKCGKTTIAEFLSRFEACDRNVLSYPLADEVTNERIWTLLYKTNTEDGQHSQFRELEYEKVVSSLKKEGIDTETPVETLQSGRSCERQKALQLPAVLSEGGGLGGWTGNGQPHPAQSRREH